MKKVILISTFERETIVSQFKTLKEAQEAMFAELEDELGFKPLFEDEENELIYDLSSTGSWFNSSRGNFDWLIVELE